MRLLTHNSLRSCCKGTLTGYPLKLECQQMEIRESEFNEDFMRHLVPSLDWHALVSAAEAVGFQGLPCECTDELLENVEFLKACHKILLVSLSSMLVVFGLSCTQDIHVLKGFLVCPDTGRKYEIVDGVPDMTYVDSVVVLFSDRTVF